MLDKKNPISSENNKQSESELTLVEVGEGALKEFQQLLDENRKTVDRMLQDHLKELFKDFHFGASGSRNLQLKN